MEICCGHNSNCIPAVYRLALNEPDLAEFIGYGLQPLLAKVFPLQPGIPRLGEREGGKLYCNLLSLLVNSLSQGFAFVSGFCDQLRDERTLVSCYKGPLTRPLING